MTRSNRAINQGSSGTGIRAPRRRNTPLTRTIPGHHRAGLAWRVVAKAEDLTGEDLGNNEPPSGRRSSRFARGIGTARCKRAASFQQVQAQRAGRNPHSESANPRIERILHPPVGGKNQCQGTGPEPLRNGTGVGMTDPQNMLQERFRRCTHENQRFVGWPTFQRPDVQGPGGSDRQADDGIGRDYSHHTLTRSEARRSASMTAGLAFVMEKAQQRGDGRWRNA